MGCRDPQNTALSLYRTLYIITGFVVGIILSQFQGVTNKTLSPPFLSLYPLLFQTLSHSLSSLSFLYLSSVLPFSIFLSLPVCLSHILSFCVSLTLLPFFPLSVLCPPFLYILCLSPLSSPSVSLSLCPISFTYLSSLFPFSLFLFLPVCLSPILSFCFSLSPCPIFPLTLLFPLSISFPLFLYLSAPSVVKSAQMRWAECSEAAEIEREHQLPLLWWWALWAGRTTGFPVCWLRAIMLFAPTLFLIGLPPLPWQQKRGSAFWKPCDALVYLPVAYLDTAVSGEAWSVKGCLYVCVCVRHSLCPQL